jgi:hypothetical protein
MINYYLSRGRTWKTDLGCMCVILLAPVAIATSPFWYPIGKLLYDEYSRFKEKREKKTSAEMYFENQPWIWPTEYAAAILETLKEKDMRGNYFLTAGEAYPFDDPPTVTTLVCKREQKKRIWPLKPEARDKVVAYARHTSVGRGPGNMYIEAAMDQSELENLVKGVQSGLRQEGPFSVDVEGIESSIDDTARLIGRNDSVRKKEKD